MHPRNRYQHSKPDFGSYAATRPSLKPFLIEKKRASSEGFVYTLDFSNQEALRELTCACLEHDFGLRVEIPKDCLVPTVPQKLNYIHWIEDLLALGSAGGEFPTRDHVTGIDIGTGASCIYPLLGAKINGWHFVATDVLPESVKCASGNVSRNGLEDKVTVKLVPPDTVLDDAVDTSSQVCYDFCMCNPPFFKDKEDKKGTQSRTTHRPVPSTQNTGNESETITQGGEVEFVKRIIADSLKLKEKIRWYSTMLGKKTSLKAIKAELRKKEIPVVHSSQFVQGKTHRWAVAWSFVSPTSSSSSSSSAPYSGKKQKTFFLPRLPLPSERHGLREATEWLQTLWKDLKIEYTILHQSDTAVSHSCRAVVNTWSHQRRRRRLQARLRQQEEEDDDDKSEVGSVEIQREELTTATAKEEQIRPSSALKKGSPGLAQQLQHSSKAELLSQLESLDTPCQLEFTSTLCVNTTKEDLPPQAKRKKMEGSGDGGGGGREESEDNLSLSLEWISGEDRDNLHQILQLIHNRLADS